MGKDGSETTETKNVPWGPQGEQLERGYDWSRELSQIVKQYFPGQTVGGRDRLSIEARGMTGQLGGEEYRQQGEDYLTQILRGDFMQVGGENPYLDQLSDVYGNKAREQYQRSTAPTNFSRFAGAGRSSSDAMNKAMGQSNREFSEGLTRANAAIYKGDYDMRRDERFRALGMMPMMQGMSMNDIGQRRQQGAIEENYLQRLLNSDIDRFNFGQGEEDVRLDQFMQRISGNMGFGSRSSQTTQSGNLLGDILGGVGTAASIIGNLYGGNYAGAAITVGNAVGGGGGGGVSRTANAWGLGSLGTGY